MCAKNPRLAVPGFHIIFCPIYGGSLFAPLLTPQSFPRVSRPRSSAGRRRVSGDLHPATLLYSWTLAIHETLPCLAVATHSPSRLISPWKPMTVSSGRISCGNLAWLSAALSTSMMQWSDVISMFSYTVNLARWFPGYVNTARILTWYFISVLADFSDLESVSVDFVNVALDPSPARRAHVRVISVYAVSDGFESEALFIVEI